MSNTNQNKQAQPVGDEREAFNQWVDDYALKSEPNWSTAAEADCFAAWQARAALAAQAPQQEVQYDHGPQAETVAEASRDVGKWLNERPNRPLDLRHVAMLAHHATAQPEIGRAHV